MACLCLCSSGRRAAPLYPRNHLIWRLLQQVRGVTAFMKHCEVCLKILYKHRLSQNDINEHACHMVHKYRFKVHEPILDFRFIAADEYGYGKKKNTVVNSSS